MIAIPDASVAVKWFVRTGEGGLEAADEVLKRVVERPDEFAVPSLFYYEVHAVLCRRLGDARRVSQALQAIWALAIPAVSPDEPTMTRAAELALTHRLTGYDAVYAAVASHLGGVWLTFDAEACRRVSALGLARLLSAR